MRVDPLPFLPDPENMNAAPVVSSASRPAKTASAAPGSTTAPHIGPDHEHDDDALSGEMAEFISDDFVNVAHQDGLFPHILSRFFSLFCCACACV